MFRTSLLTVSIALAALPAAAAERACPQHQAVIDELRVKYDEAPVAMGLASNGGVIEVFATGEGSTWTILITMPDGSTCMVATGQAWETLPIAPLGPEA
jgi:hypothetical protein